MNAINRPFNIEPRAHTIYVTPIGYICTCDDVFHNTRMSRIAITGAEARRQADLHAEHYHRFCGDSMTIVDYRQRPTKGEVKQALEFAWEAGMEDTCFHEGLDGNLPHPKDETVDGLLNNIWKDN